MANAAKFWDRMAARYSRQPIADEEAYQHKLALTREHLGAHMHVLEVGCGTGSTAILHAPHVAQLLATDISANMLAIAEQKARAEGLENIRFVQCAVEDVPVADDSQDIVLALSVLHLLPNWPAAIRDLYAKLKPGGLLISSTACIGDMSWPMRLLPPVMKLLPGLPSVQAFSAGVLTEAMRDCGFELVDRWQPGPDKALFLVAMKPHSKE